MCACERTIASIWATGIGRRRFFSSVSDRFPWKRPQSRRIVRPFARRMWQLPVTSRAAPTNSSSMRSGQREGMAPPAAARRSALADALALEDDRQAGSFLRHHRRLPPAATPLVEQVRQRVLVVARQTREADDDRLVFFHGREDT